MWIAVAQSVAPGLEEAFRQLIRLRGKDLGELGRRHGLRQMRVFQRGAQGMMMLEVEDPQRFGGMTSDPEFQVLGQELSSLMNFRPFDQAYFWNEVFAWPPEAAAESKKDEMTTSDLEDAS